MSQEPKNPQNPPLSAPSGHESGGKISAQPQKSFAIYFAAFVVAAAFAGAISRFFLGESLAALGIPDPGALTTIGLPALRAAAWLLMALAVGSFLSAAFLINPAVRSVEGELRLWEARLSVDGHIAARTGAYSALAVAVISLLQAPLVLSDLTGTPFFQVFNAQLLGMAISQIASAQVWLITATLAAAVCIGGLLSRTWMSQPLLLAGAVALVIPLGMEGHSASGGDHDYGTNSYLWHLVFMALWVGGLLALIAHGRRLAPHYDVAVRRYSNIALFAVIVMAVSGLVNAAIRVEWSDWFTTRYGLILVAKTVCTVLLALFGLAHRQIAIPRLAGNPRLFLRVAVVEVLLMAATVGIAVTMGRTPPPPPRDPNLNSMQILLGYELFDAPTLTNVWTQWRFDILFGTIGLLLAAGYVWAYVRLRRRGLDWPLGRLLWWLAGCVTLVVTMCSGIGMYIPALYSMHMLGHMILSMVVPLFLVLGAPLTLVTYAWEPGRDGVAGPHEWAVAVSHSRVIKWLTHPGINLVQFLVVFYTLYLSFEFYNFAISEHAGHVLMNSAFLVSGYIYFWEVIGLDPLPKRAPTRIRLFILFVSMPIHLFAGVYLMQLREILGETFYQSLSLPWHPDFYQDQRVGGGIAWGFGQFPLALVFAKLFIDWLRDDRSEARRHDAKADVDGDMDLADYNAMLAKLADGGGSQHYRPL